ncbi:MAG: ABC transporter permease [Xanthomonadaceae bacterium]|nr:ABC transporter permease [Xanthomonadaceae bacterium]
MWFLAIRHLVARKRQTLFTLLGIIFGATAFIVISGFFSGFQNFLITQLLDNDAHLKIFAKEDLVTEHSLDQYFFKDAEHVFWISPPGGKKDLASITDPQGWYRRLKSDPRVIAYSPHFTSQILVTRAKASVSGRLIGVDPHLQTKVTNIENYMEMGRFTDIGSGGNRVVVGDDFLGKVGAHYGETILISNGISQPKPFKVVGVFHTGMKPIDGSSVYGGLVDAQKMNGTPDVINEIAVRVTDTDEAKFMAEDWRQSSHEKIESWDETNANFLSVFKIQNATRYMMIAVILIVAGFGIYNILNMVVNQKRKDIAILRSMGFETSEIISLFLIQGLILGIVGAFSGMVFGFLICLYLETIRFGGGPLGGAGFLRISYAPVIYIQALVLSVACSSFASFLPARAAGRMQPIEIIRAGAD